MGKLKHRAAVPKMASPSAASESRTPTFDPLPPPRRNKALLTVAIALVVAWLCFLGYLVLVS